MGGLYEAYHLLGEPETTIESWESVQPFWELSFGGLKFSLLIFGNAFTIHNKKSTEQKNMSLRL